MALSRSESGCPWSKRYAFLPGWATYLIETLCVSARAGGLHGPTLTIFFANRIPFLPAVERRSLSGSSEPKKDCSVEHGKVELLTFPHRSKSCPFAAGRKQQSMPLFPANTKAFPVSAMTGTSKKVSLSRKYKYDFHEKIFPLATQLSHAQKAFWGQTTCPVESAAFD